MLPHSRFLTGIAFINVFSVVLSKYEVQLNRNNVITPQTYAIWKNATVPFYVDPEHYDHEQTLSILTALSMFAFKTCLKFRPVMARPSRDDEVLVFVNPEGTRRCEVESKGHSVFNPHLIKLGYDCLKSPDIDMIIMKALGFPFEHNRVSRDLYIDVLFENIRPGAIELFTKEDTLPLELRFLPYDINSVMHFGTREYSKNGHRTIIFKDRNAQQKRVGLTETDLKKIEIVYGPECRARDRQEKIELCQSYPGVARKKREAEDNTRVTDVILDNVERTAPVPIQRNKRELDLDVTKSLRVNPDITPAPENLKTDVSKTLKELGIDQAVQDLVEHVYKVSSLALRTARNKYCNNSEPPAITEDVKVSRNGSDILGIIELVTDFAKGMVDNAVKNLTKFCEVSDGIEAYQRYSCDWSAKDSRCRYSYRSTQSGAVRYSTQHRPIIPQSTKHYGGASHIQYGREGNETVRNPNLEVSTALSVRRKRDLDTTTKKSETNKQINQEDTNIKDDKADPKKGDNEDQNKAEETGEKKQEANSKKKAKYVNEKEEAAEQNKQEAKDKKAKGETKDKAKENVKVKNKDRLKRKSMSTKIIRRNHSRRNRDRKHRGKYSNDYSKEESNSDTAERHPEKKHSEEYEKKEKEERDKKRRFKKIKNVAKSEIESHENGQNVEEIEVKHKLNYGENGNFMKEMEEKERQQSHISKARPSRTLLPETVALSKKNQEFYDERKWPDGRLYYMIENDDNYDISDMRSRLAEVNNILERGTCVKMIEIEPGKGEYEDYIVIDKSPDYVTGRVGGRQNFGGVELYRGGQHRQHAAMMAMAMLGFYFEVSRHDRDKYIRVHMRHVRPDKLHHFEKIRADATLPLPYDYASATHPAWQFWRQVGRTGISTVATYKEKDPDGRIMKSLGQNEKLLSDLDIVKINSVYGVDCFKKSRVKNESSKSFHEYDS